MSKRSAVILILLSTVLAPLGAIGFGYHVIEARAETDFAMGIFPVAVNYQFNFPVPDLIGGSMTELAFRLDNGLDFRTLRQDPEDGSFYACTGADHTLDYMVLYDEFRLLFNQGFWNDRFTLGVSIDGRFENAYESIAFKGQGDEGLFWDPDGNQRFDSFSGAPELAGGRSIFQTYVSAELGVDLMDDGIVTKDGLSFNSFFRITGPWMPLSDGSGDFLLSHNSLSVAKTLFSVSRSSGLEWFSVVLEGDFTYRYIHGSKVPLYVQGGKLWPTWAPATEHVFTGEVSATFYGPQLTADTYLGISLFAGCGWSLGNALNSSQSGINEFVSVYGIKAELMVLDVLSLYWDWGFVNDPAFNEPQRAVSRLGFTFGV